VKAVPRNHDYLFIMREESWAMLQTIILIVIVGAAAAYVFFSVAKSLTRPDRGCGHESECPYAAKCTGRHDCPYPPGDDGAPAPPRN
jgi:hypothetical protein